MAKHTKMGRASIFRGKWGGVRVQGILTAAGGASLDRHRRALARLYREVIGKAPAAVSDADVIEFLARGEVETRKCLELEAERVAG